MASDSTPSRETFDPYHKWLGIAPGKPKTLYRLLGLDDFEADADAIAAGMDRQMAHVKTYATGPRSALSQAILNELSSAGITLLDADKKGAYDAQLRAERAQAEAAAAKLAKAQEAKARPIQQARPIPQAQPAQQPQAKPRQGVDLEAAALGIAPAPPGAKKVSPHGAAPEKKPLPVGWIAGAGAVVATLAIGGFILVRAASSNGNATDPPEVAAAPDDNGAPKPPAPPANVPKPPPAADHRPGDDNANAGAGGNNNGNGGETSPANSGDSVAPETPQPGGEDTAAAENNSAEQNSPAAEPKAEPKKEEPPPRPVVIEISRAEFDEAMKTLGMVAQSEYDKVKQAPAGNRRREFETLIKRLRELSGKKENPPAVHKAGQIREFNASLEFRFLSAAAATLAARDLAYFSDAELDADWAALQIQAVDMNNVSFVCRAVEARLALEGDYTEEFAQADLKSCQDAVARLRRYDEAVTILEHRARLGLAESAVQEEYSRLAQTAARAGDYEISFLIAERRNLPPAEFLAEKVALLQEAVKAKSDLRADLELSDLWFKFAVESLLCDDDEKRFDKAKFCSQQARAIAAAQRPRGTVEERKGVLERQRAVRDRAGELERVAAALQTLQSEPENAEAGELAGMFYLEANAPEKAMRLFARLDHPYSAAARVFLNDEGQPNIATGRAVKKMLDDAELRVATLREGAAKAAAERERERLLGFVVAYHRQLEPLAQGLDKEHVKQFLSKHPEVALPEPEAKRSLAGVSPFDLTQYATVEEYYDRVFSHIQRALDEKQTVVGEKAGGPGGAHQHAVNPPEAAIMVGIRGCYGNYHGSLVIGGYCLIYQTANGRVESNFVGSQAGQAFRAEAPPGYYVSAIGFSSGIVVDGMQLQYQPILVRKNNKPEYSQWIGGRAEKAPYTIHFDGKPIIGTRGSHGSVIDFIRPMTVKEAW